MFGVTTRGSQQPIRYFNLTMWGYYRQVDMMSGTPAIFLVKWTPREVIREYMPQSFREKFPNTRIIIDCTELLRELKFVVTAKFNV